MLARADGAYHLTVPIDKSTLAVTWLRDQSDGYVAADVTDPLRKLPGPIIIRDPSTLRLGSGQASLRAGAGTEETLHAPEAKGDDIDATKPYFIGSSVWALETPAPLPAFEWKEPDAARPPKKTALNATHRVLGGRMVPFAGWEMPVQYTGVLEEHQATRQAAGLFDVSHMGVWEASGPGACAFLDAVTTNEVAALRPGQSMYSQFLAPNAHVLDDCYVYMLAGEHYLIVVNASNDDKDWTWVNAVKNGEVMIDIGRPWATAPGRNAVTLRNLRADSSGPDMRVDIALQGPRSRDILLALGADSATTKRIKALKRTGLYTGTVGGYD